MLLGAHDAPQEHQARAIASGNERWTSTRASAGVEAPVSESIAREIGQLRAQPSEGLPTSVRSQAEQRFGTNLDGLRVHRDARAASITRSLGASAASVGQDLLFSPGSYKPNSSAGQRLITHEVAHALQRPRVGPEVIRRAEPREEQRIQELDRIAKSSSPGISITFTSVGDTDIEDIGSQRKAQGQPEAKIGTIFDIATGLDIVAIELGLLTFAEAQPNADAPNAYPAGRTAFVRELKVLGHGNSGELEKHVGYQFGAFYNTPELREVMRSGLDFSRYMIDGATLHLEGCLVGKGELGRRYLALVGEMFFGSKRGYIVANTCLASGSVLPSQIAPCGPRTLAWPGDFGDLAGTADRCDPLLQNVPSGEGCFHDGKRFVSAKTK